MKHDALIANNRDTILGIAKKYGAQSIRVFGSHARGANHDNSDLDLLVTLAPNRTLLDLIAIKQDLEDILECHVDVVTEASLSTYVRDQILSEAIAL